MDKTQSQTVQDYLKHIYNLTENGTSANTNMLASLLNLKPGSVSEMVLRLAEAEPPLVNYVKYQGVTLTPAGRLEALKVIRRHRLIETFLVEVLGYSWDAIHEEACILEHATSDLFEKRIADVLGNPSFSPHGEPIPTESLELPVKFSISLFSLQAGDQATIQQVPDTDPELLRHLFSIGMIPQSTITVLNRSNFDGNITLRFLSQTESITLGPSITKKILVTLLE